MWIVMAVWRKSLTGSSARAGLVFFVLGLAISRGRSAGCSPTGCAGAR